MPERVTIQPWRYFELIVHKSILEANDNDKRAAIFMNKYLGYVNTSKEADILCVGEKNNITFGIIIECKNFVLPRGTRTIDYYGELIDFRKLIRILNLKRTDGATNIGIDRILVLGVFNDKHLDLEQVSPGVFVVGNSVDFPISDFNSSSDMSPVSAAWCILSEGMKALPKSHELLRKIDSLPVHKWYQNNRDYPLGENNIDIVNTREINQVDNIINEIDEDYDGWPYPET